MLPGTCCTCMAFRPPPRCTPSHLQWNPARCQGQMPLLHLHAMGPPPTWPLLIEHLSHHCISLPSLILCIAWHRLQWVEHNPSSSHTNSSRQLVTLTVSMKSAHSHTQNWFEFRIWRHFLKKYPLITNGCAIDKKHQKTTTTNVCTYDDQLREHWNNR